MRPSLVLPMSSTLATLKIVDVTCLNNIVEVTCLQVHYLAVTLGNAVQVGVDGLHILVIVKAESSLACTYAHGYGKQYLSFIHVQYGVTIWLSS